MTRNLLSARWQTERLAFADATLADAAAAQSIYDACHYVRVWEGKGEDTCSMVETIPNLELPPEGEARYVRMQMIVRQEDQAPIGFFQGYHGYPDAEVFFIALFYLHPDYQQKGYGREAINSLADALKDLGYKHIQLAVGLRNWPGFYFWMQNGFTRLVRWRGERVFGADTPSFVVVERDL